MSVTCKQCYLFTWKPCDTQCHICHASFCTYGCLGKHLEKGCPEHTATALLEISILKNDIEYLKKELKKLSDKVISYQDNKLNK